MTGHSSEQDIAEFADTADEAKAKFKKHSDRLKRNAGQQSLYAITSDLEIKEVEVVVKNGRVVNGPEDALAYYSQNDKKNPETPQGDQSASPNGRDHHLVHLGLEYALHAIRADPETRDDERAVEAFKALDLEIISALELSTQLLTTPQDQKPEEINRIDGYGELVQQLLVGCEPKAIRPISFGYTDNAKQEEIRELEINYDGSLKSVNILKITREQAEQLKSRLESQVSDYNTKLRKLSGIFFRSDGESSLSSDLPARLENLKPGVYFAKPHSWVSMLISQAYEIANKFNGLTSEGLKTFGDTKKQNKALFEEIRKTKALLYKAAVYFGIEQDIK